MLGLPSLNYLNNFPIIYTCSQSFNNEHEFQKVLTAYVYLHVFECICAINALFKKLASLDFVTGQDYESYIDRVLNTKE